MIAVHLPKKIMFMRKITLIIVHCSANKAGSKLRMADIDRYHRTLGWTGCGYHYVIPIDGTIEPARPEDITGAHCRSHNSHSIGICYIGGLASDNRTPKDTRTTEQKVALLSLIKFLKGKFPNAAVIGHRDTSPDTNSNGIIEPSEWLKACPSFDAKKEYATL